VSSDFLQTVFSNIWAIFLVVLLFGGSIFVHELGHFLAARRRGVHVDRFSIGFGPAIWSWRGRDGVEYRVSWFPLGGYVLLPQLADLSAIEGESSADAAKLPPVGYLTKMIVFVAGATFNVLFAFVLACIVWIIGQPVATNISSTTIAEIAPTIKTNGKEVISPAAKAGLKSGDLITAIDGAPVSTFGEIQERLALSSGWTEQGERQTVFTVRRNDVVIDVPVQPVISGNEKVRMVGFYPMEKLVVGRLTPQDPLAKAGLKIDDQIVAVGSTPTLNTRQLRDALRAAPDNFALTVMRNNQRIDLPVQWPKSGKDREVSLPAFKAGIIYEHPSPFEQVGNCVAQTVRTLGAVLNRHSDIGVSHLSGPIGIISNFVDVSRAGLPFALWFTILVNVNLAIFNLLPMPVLDGGQMLFATIGRLRGRALPMNFIMAAQSVFLVLLFSMMIYVSFFVDIPRIVRESKAERAAEAAAQSKP
jgi:regulator of sigma E protease